MQAQQLYYEETEVKQEYNPVSHTHQQLIIQQHSTHSLTKIEEEHPKQHYSSHLQSNQQGKKEEHYNHKRSKNKQNEPTQQDLCDMLQLIRKAVPHRSLEKCIIQVYQAMKKKYQHLEQMQQQQQKQLQSNVANKSDMAFSQVNQYNHLQGQQSQYNQQQQNSMQQGSEKSDERREAKPEKLMLPGRKISCYHHISAQIAAPSREYYKKVGLTVEEINAMQKNITGMPVTRNQQSQVYNGKLQDTSTLMKGVVLHFRQADTARKKFLSPVEEKKHLQRCKLAQLFIERGYGASKAVDDELPKIDIDRDTFRNRLVGVLISTFRKLESILVSELKKTIKYLDMQQMKTLSQMMVNCRVVLDPIPCQILFKLLKINYGLQDVILTQGEAIECYNSTMKLLKGKGITMQKLQKMGQIANRRSMQSKMEQWKKMVIVSEQKNQKKIDKQLSQFNNSTVHRVDNKQREQTITTNLNRHMNYREDRVWTAEIDMKLADLYVLYGDLPKIKDFLDSQLNRTKNITVGEYEERIKELVSYSLIRIANDSVLILKRKPELKLLSPKQVKMVIAYEDGEKLKKKIIMYGVLNEFSLLVYCINSIKEVLSGWRDSTKIYEESQPQPNNNNHFKLQQQRDEQMIDLKSQSIRSESTNRKLVYLSENGSVMQNRQQQSWQNQFLDLSSNKNKADQWDNLDDQLWQQLDFQG